MAKRNERGRMALTIIFTLICIAYVMPILIVLMNSFKSNAAVNTETFAFPNADSFVGLRIGDDETCAVAACGAGRPDETPERKRFARTDEDAVDLRCGERKVDGFVVLQHRIDLAERAADEGIVAVDERGKRRFRARFGKVLTGCDVAQRAERAAFLNRNAVRER